MTKNTKLLRGFSCNNDLKLVKVFVDKKDVDVNVGLEGAGYYGHYEVVKYLLENGADIMSQYGQTALLVSKVRCHYKTHKLLQLYMRKHKLDKVLNHEKGTKKI